jgi:hypothetical protein
MAELEKLHDEPGTKRGARPIAGRENLIVGVSRVAGAAK